MVRNDSGVGRLFSARETARRRAAFGPWVAGALDLNRASATELSANPLVGRSLAARIVRLRKQSRILAPADLLHAGLIDGGHLRALQAGAFGASTVAPLMTAIEIDGPHLYVGERFALHFRWTDRGAVAPAILSIRIRFPSGRVRSLDVRLTRKNVAAASTKITGFVSGQSGELHVLATLRDVDGGVSRMSALFGVFTRNPVQMFVTPQYLTQSGAAGAPKYDFGENRWYCHADVRWVNGESRSINLGRRVDVHVTDAGVGTVADFSFNLSGDVVVPAFGTVYGSLRTWHGAGGIFDVFNDKGDLTFRYSMSGSGFTPMSTVVWRTMRVIGYNIIRVGDFSATERDEYRRAAEQIASGILSSRDLSVYGVELYRIEGSPEMDADKTRFRFIDSQDEINAMRSRYTVRNWYLDVFFVEGRWDGAFGSSPTNGPVDKEGNASGLVIMRDSDTVNLGQTFAHEAGHYLGLEHADENDGCADTDPLAPDISDNFIFSSSRSDSDVITRCQSGKMRRHGLVRAMTP